MKSHEFYQKFANLPLDKRFEIIDRINYGELTMNGLYLQMKKLQEEIRSIEEKEQRLLEIAEKYFEFYEEEIKLKQ